DYTGHHAPLGSPQHLAAIAGADALVKQVFETVRRLDPTGEDILFVTGSDHGMETVADSIDLTELLMAAGVKESRESRELVVAPNGTAATLYFADPAGELVGRVARFLAGENWVGEMFAGERLGAAGLPTDTAMQIAVSLAAEDRTNPHGVTGYAPIVQDPSDNESKIGSGQHGGLGPHEQRPFLIVVAGRAGAALAAKKEPKAPPPPPEKKVGAIEELMRQHGVLRRVLLVYRQSAAQLRGGGKLDPKLLRQAAQLFRDFGENFHERML